MPRRAFKRIGVAANLEKERAATLLPDSQQQSAELAKRLIEALS